VAATVGAPDGPAALAAAPAPAGVGVELAWAFEDDAATQRFLAEALRASALSPILLTRRDAAPGRRGRSSTLSRSSPRPPRPTTTGPIAPPLTSPLLSLIPRRTPLPLPIGCAALSLASVSRSSGPQPMRRPTGRSTPTPTRTPPAPPPRLPSSWQRALWRRSAPPRRPPRRRWGRPRTKRPDWRNVWSRLTGQWRRRRRRRQRRGPPGGTRRGPRASQRRPTRGRARPSATPPTPRRCWRLLLAAR